MLTIHCLRIIKTVSTKTEVEVEVELKSKSFTETQTGPKYESQKETGGDVVCG